MNSRGKAAVAVPTLASLMLMVAACSGAGEGGDEGTETLVLASAANTSINMGKAIEHFAEIVNSGDSGLEIETHLDGSLYSEATAVEAVQTGGADLGTISDGNYGAFGDAMFFMNLPYVFEDREQFSQFILESDLANDVREQVEDETGLAVVGLLENTGFRWLGQQKEVRQPSDMRGIRYRTVDSPVEIDLIKAWGGSPTPVAWAETYNALSQGVVDGLHSLYDWSDAAGHFEVLSNVTEVDAVIGVHLLYIDRARLDEFTDEQQEAILQAGEETEAWIIDQNTEINEEIREEAISRGIDVYEPTESEAAQWREMATNTLTKYRDQIPNGLLEGIESLSEGEG